MMEHQQHINQSHRPDRPRTCEIRPHPTPVPMPRFVEPRRSNPVRQKFESHLRSAIAYCSKRGLDLRFAMVGAADRGLVTTDGSGFRLGYCLEVAGAGIPDPWDAGDLVLAALRDAVWNTAERNVDDLGDRFVLRLRDRVDPSVTHTCEVSVTARDADGALLVRARDPSTGGCGFHRMEGTADFDRMVSDLHPDGTPSGELRRRCLVAIGEDPGRSTALVYAEAVVGMHRAV